MNFIRKHRKKTIAITCTFVLLAGAAMMLANHACKTAAVGRIYRSTADIPANDVALLLGTSKLTPRGTPNLHFIQRIDAAAALYRSGKVRRILVSGDNHVAGYDEATDMRDALVAAGVPAAAITRDYAGFRTLDSVQRAKLVFGLERLTIVTEEFHCPRALWIARHNGMEAVAFAAPDLKSAVWTWRVDTREYFARAWCGVDLFILHRRPRFPGPFDPIVLSANSTGTRGE